MTPFASLGRALVAMGIVLLVVGLALTLLPRLPRVPGDIVIQRPNLTVYIPIGTMILASVLLTLLLNLMIRR
ncbi:MAG: DUF2905 domain-containing protein [Armatimonadota bacterium]|nr:DUF2905 domain-containing protein [Armatimonadota bacterium]MDR7533363.1 DUF2905 domain-containing protein [Armatimonadota bacterium]MDR7536483.1 DUF2905 domain-containing protein [Armatimonadota bacterium]